MSSYSPGRDHPHSKEVKEPREIVALLNKRKTGYTVTWSAGHSRGAARVKAFKANRGYHPAWIGIGTDALLFTIVPDPTGDTNTWNITVRRI